MCVTELAARPSQPSSKPAGAGLKEDSHGRRKMLPPRELSGLVGTEDLGHFGTFRNDRERSAEMKSGFEIQ